MTKIAFIQPDGSEKPVEARDGLSLMEAAVNNGVDGITAECNGSLACATCHVVLPQDLFEALEAPGEYEEDMLEFAEVPRQACSRLACQVKISPQLDGAVIQVPAG